MKNNLFQDTYIDTLAIDKLITDEYQRTSENNSPTKIRKMAREFDAAQLGTITVSLRNGKYYVVDGQHRVLASRVVGIKALRAEVHTNLSKEQEAELFVKLNSTSTKVTKAQMYQAYVVAKDPIALHIKQMAESKGMRVGQHTGDGRISAYGTLEKIYKKLGSETLDKTLELIKICWGGDASSVNRYFIEGVAYFIHVYGPNPYYSDEKFIKQLSKVSSTKLFAEMKADTTSSKIRVKAMNILHRYYNSRLTKQLPHTHFNS